RVPLRADRRGEVEGPPPLSPDVPALERAVAPARPPVRAEPGEPLPPPRDGDLDPDLRRLLRVRRGDAEPRGQGRPPPRPGGVVRRDLLRVARRRVDRWREVLRRRRLLRR